MYGRKLKIEVINHYGSKCAICGESHMEFLSIDHSFNDGAKHRREIGISGNSGHFYKWIKRNDFPDNIGLRVLCNNCNMSVSAYGYSPYEEGQGDRFMKIEKRSKK